MSIGMMRTNVGAKGKAQPHYNYIMAEGRYTKKADEIEYKAEICHAGREITQPNCGNVPTCLSEKMARLTVNILSVYRVS